MPNPVWPKAGVARDAKPVVPNPPAPDVEAPNAEGVDVVPNVEEPNADGREVAPNADVVEEPNADGFLSIKYGDALTLLACS